MKIWSVEIQNFRKLKTTHIDFEKETTILVGANNSGKTSAMVALRYFLVAPENLSLRDITIANWIKIDEIGKAWEEDKEAPHDIQTLLPALDVWLEASVTEIHHIIHILPSIDWEGGLVGVRLRYELKALDKLRMEYLRERGAAQAVLAQASERGATITRIWPTSLTDFLLNRKRFSKYRDLRAYSLDPTKYTMPMKGIAQPQELPAEAFPLDKNPFKSLIKVDEIAAHRDFADAGERGLSGEEGDINSRRFKRRLSEQLRAYYDRHLDPSKSPSKEDFGALAAIQEAEDSFDARLKLSFMAALDELRNLGYPGIANPKLRIATQLRAADGLKHSSAVQYEVLDPVGDGSKPLHLPEDYSGLGYQNLISMVFMLMSFRDAWMRVGKAGVDEDASRQPLHLVLVEEPEAHLHAQVQQVFISKAYDLLRNHDELRNGMQFSTQLVVSTHSSHIAHEADFASLRYFRRRPKLSHKESATTTVSNLSELFGTGDVTHRFVKRYLKATHCDLFFADGAIFVEGQAERILIPHFIRHHYPKLSSRYITVLEIGGSHTHKFRPLIDALGLTTLVIADLDAVKATKVQQGDKEVLRRRAVKPEMGQGQETSNPVLREWYPGIESIDRLLSLKPDDHVVSNDGDYKLYVAYQKRMSIASDKHPNEEVIPRTFEDSLVFTNLDALADIAGESTTRRIKALVDEALSGADLADALFEFLKKAEKAEFALACLAHDPQAILPPPYVADGLRWLESALDEQTAADTVLP